MMDHTLTLESAEFSARAHLAALGACIGGLIALALGVWLAMPLSPVSEQRYLATVEDHVAMLAASKGEKGRIVLLGGSGTAFSLSAEALTQQLGRPVYNGGIQATLGFRNLIDLYRPHLDPANDTIVLLPEPEMVAMDDRWSQTWCDALFLSKNVAGLMREPRCVPGIVWRTWQEVRHHARHRGQASVGIDPVYRRSGFNARGDLTSHLALDRPPPDFSDYAFPRVPPAKVARLVDHARLQLAAEGFDLLYIPAAMPQSACEAAPEAVRALTAQLARLNTGAPADHPVEASCLPPALFFDGAGHLGREGRALWTRRVGEVLAQSLAG